MSRCWRVLFIIWFTAVIFSLPAPYISEAAVGDGKCVYGNRTAPTNEPKTRDYSVSSGNWSGVGNLPAANTTINYVLVKTSPQADEYVAGVVTSTGPTLYVYTYSSGAWALSWSATVPSTAYQVFDIAYERDSGDCLVVYSNGATSNEISYRKRVDGVWDGASTTLNSSRTTGAVRFIELVARPNSDEIAMAFSDANSDLSAFVWNGASWGSEPTAALSTNLDLATIRSFDLAYEQVSGNLLVAYSILNTAGCGLARKLAGQTTWTDTNDEGALLDPSTFIDLAAEAGTNYIAFCSMDDASRDMQMAVWNGTDTAPFNFQYTFNNADTAAATWAVPRQPAACGWAGAGANRRAVFIYRDVAATTVPYFTWLKSSTSWEQSANTPATYSPPTTSGTNNFIFTYDDLQNSDTLWVTYIDGNRDFWTFQYDGATSTTNWATVDDGTAGNIAVDADVATATNNCGDMAFTYFNPTIVDLTSLRAETRDNKAVISWRTASELRALGFKVYRTFIPADHDSYEDITGKMIPAKGTPLYGRNYEFVDKDYLEGVYYVVEEVQKDGRVKKFSPVQLDVKSTFLGAQGQDETKPLFKRDGALELNGNSFAPRLKPAKNLSSAKLFKKNFDFIKIEVDREGIYRISAQDLANAGWDVQAIIPEYLALFNQEEEVPIYVYEGKDRKFSSSGYIEFYGKPNSTRYTTVNAYWLKVIKTAGARMKEISSGQKASAQTVAPYKLVMEENAAYYPEFKGSEHWFFIDEFISPFTAQYTINVDHIAAARDKAFIKIGLQGGSQMGFGPDYNRQRAIIRLNGNALGEANWARDTEFIFSKEVPAGLLKEGANTLTIEAPDEESALTQFFLINWMEITYPRQLVAVDNKAIFDSDASSNANAFKIRGFSTLNVKGFAIRDNEVLRLTNLLARKEAEGDYSVSFSDPSSGSRRYIILAADSFGAPVNTYPYQGASLKDRSNQADYLIITHGSFSNALTPLADYRSSQGLNVKVVDVQDIYDQFGSGIFSPLAIKDFLKYTYEYWQKPSPLFALFVGDGTFDYRDFWQRGQENLVPAYLSYSPDFGETVTDNWFVDFDSDAVPEMFIGRLPVNDEVQLGAVMDKIIAYEGVNPDANWTQELYFVADNEEKFEEEADALADLIPPDFLALKLRVRESGAEAARQSIIDELNNGKLIFNYTGHAGVSLLSSESIFQNSDVFALDNGANLPIFLAQDCLTGYFIYPEGMDALSEVLLRAPGKGAVACITSSGLSSGTEQGIFSEGFYRAFFDADNPPVLGAIHFKAKEFLYENKGLVGSDNKTNNIIQTFNLLGDPALVLRKKGSSFTHYSASLMQRLRALLQ